MCSNPRFKNEKWKIKYENEFFQLKDCDINNQKPFFVYKFPKKWHILVILKVFQKVKTVDFRFSWAAMWILDPDMAKW